MQVGFGGMRTYTDNLVRSLQKMDHGFDITVINTEIEGIRGNLTFTALPYKKLPGRFFIRNFYQIPKLLQEFQPDAVLETTHFGPFRVPTHTKRFTVIHDVTTFLFPKYHKWNIRWIEKLFVPRIIRKSSQIITVSECSKKDIMSQFGVKKDKISAIHLGKEDVFRQVNDLAILDKHGIRKPYFLHVGTIEPRKNIITLIDAYTAFRQSSDCNHSLVLTGMVGWKSAKIMKAIKDNPYHDDIIVTGHAEKSDLPVIYSMCEAFIYPSFYEGFGLPLLEAMSCGAPCIASNTSSIPEVGGDAPLYFDPFDKDELQRCMKKVAKDASLQNEMRRASLNRANKFGWEETARQLVEIISI